MNTYRYDPWAHAAAMNIRVIKRCLASPTMLGCWHPDSRTIVLRKGLSHAERRCTLAHELVHAECGIADIDAPRDGPVEATVHITAARRLIHAGDLALAMMLHGDEHAQAEELEVDVPTLRARLANLAPVERALLEQQLAPLPELPQPRGAAASGMDGPSKPRAARGKMRVVDPDGV